MKSPCSEPAWYEVAPTWAARDCWHGEWTVRSWLDTPGPFHTGTADFVCFGPDVAGSCVSMNAEREDVVFRQAASAEELSAVIEAAKFDPFSGYACDGNDRWSVGAVREWWARREEERRHVVDTVLREDWFSFESLRPVVPPTNRSFFLQLVPNRRIIAQSRW
jgi:hypothetical protein